MKKLVKIQVTFEAQVDPEKDLGLEDTSADAFSDTNIETAIIDQYDEDPDMFLEDYLTSSKLVLDRATINASVVGEVDG